MSVAIERISEQYEKRLTRSVCGDIGIDDLSCKVADNGYIEPIRLIIEIDEDLFCFEIG